MKRFLFVPAIALALLSFSVAPASAQTLEQETDGLWAELSNQDYISAMVRVEMALKQCGTPDPAELEALDNRTTDIFLRASTIPRRATRQAQVVDAVMLMDMTEKLFGMLVKPAYC